MQETMGVETTYKIIRGKQNEGIALRATWTKWTKWP